MSWCFAIINNRLAEIYFEKKNEKIKFLGHCYVKEWGFKSKREKAWIKMDIAKMRFKYRAGDYKRIPPTI